MSVTTVIRRCYFKHKKVRYSSLGVSNANRTVTHPLAMSSTMARGLSRLELMTVLVARKDMVIMAIR